MLQRSINVNSLTMIWISKIFPSKERRKARPASDLKEITSM